MFLADTAQLLLHTLSPLLEGTPGQLRPLPGVAGAGFAWLASLLVQKRCAPLVLVADKASRAEALLRELLFFTASQKRKPELLPFPAWETLPHERISPFGPLVGERLSTLYRLTQMAGSGPVQATDEEGVARAIIVTTPMALMQRLMPRQVLARHGFTLSVGDQLDLSAFRRFLSEAGYRAVAQVQEAGEFAVRGGIVDLFPSGREEPIRIELFGDEVETLRLFDPVSQRSTDPIRTFKALPVCEVVLDEESIASFRTRYRSQFGGDAAEDEIYREISRGAKVQGMEQYLPLFYDRVETFFDYLPADTLFLLEPGVMEAAQTREEEIRESAEPRLGFGMQRRLPGFSLFLSRQELEGAMRAFPALQAVEGAGGVGCVPAPDFHAQLVALEGNARPASNKGGSEISPVLEQVAVHLVGLLKQSWRVCLTVRTLGQRERLRELLRDHRVVAAEAATWEEAMAAIAGVARLAVGDVAKGFVHAQQKLMLLSEEEIFGPRLRRRKPDRRYLDMLIASFADLNEGNLVVHADHGIGSYGGLHSLSVGPIKNDYLLITYADGDKLYVPVENLDRVSKYAGGEEAPLDKLGGTQWEKTKAKARRRIMEMAEELVALQAKREAAQGIPFTPPDPLYEEFAATFPFEETPDQTQAIQSVLEDMVSPRPMDRLVCGDVGFGKTEVALRAAFRAVTDGWQVAILVPTTILAQQHFETFSKRLAPYPVKLDLLSRYRTPLQQKKTLEALLRGEVDVIIGTHRLLQDDVQFKKLGLLVVDEEQRFGVTHKERIKRFRATVDILTLTATPIPRTLHMAMAGVREISIIASPPADRLAIRTVVTQYDPQLVREAILREIYRGGQVFYVYNNVEDIDRVATELSELVPEARVGVAHGQMRENHLEKIMLSFYHQEFNLLVCTTIIENGVDIPSANTILIHRADRFGLAQLHQLRGRVGRSRHRGYAYLMIPHPQRLSEDARKRLEAIETLGDLGAGFMLATHDLEIRGAGNILGEEQSGNIKEVGFELYNQMLAQAVEALKRGDGRGQIPAGEEIVPVIHLNISTFIPDSYIPDVPLRLSMYKRLAELTGREEIGEMRVELVDRFGPMPEPVENLLRVLAIKQDCRAMRILKLDAGPKGGSLQFHAKPLVNMERLLEMIRRGEGKVRFDTQTNTMILRNRQWEESGPRLEEIGRVLAELRPSPRG